MRGAAQTVCGRKRQTSRTFTQNKINKTAEQNNHQPQRATTAWASPTGTCEGSSPFLPKPRQLPEGRGPRQPQRGLPSLSHLRHRTSPGPARPRAGGTVSSACHETGRSFLLMDGWTRTSGRRGGTQGVCSVHTPSHTCPRPLTRLQKTLRGGRPERSAPASSPGGATRF